MNANCAILVSTCDQYSDLWKPFFTLLFRHWPDCPYKIYLVTGEKCYNDPRVETLAMGTDQGWATNTKNALKKISEKYVLFTLEDYFIKSKVNTERIQYLFKTMKKRHAAYLRLYPTPGPDKILHDEYHLGIIAKEAPYRTSLMMALWDKEVLMNLMKDGETAWQMELVGTERSRFCPQEFLSVTRSKYLDRNNDPAIDYYCSAVKRGRWQLHALAIAKREGLVLDIAKREKETIRQTVWRDIRDMPIVGKCIYALLDFKNHLRLMFTDA